MNKSFNYNRLSTLRSIVTFCALTRGAYYKPLHRCVVFFRSAKHRRYSLV